MTEMIAALIPLALAGAADKEWVETDPGMRMCQALVKDRPASGGEFVPHEARVCQRATNSIEFPKCCRLRGAISDYQPR